jgi:hypothetical protein
MKNVFSKHRLGWNLLETDTGEDFPSLDKCLYRMWIKAGLSGGSLEEFKAFARGLESTNDHAQVFLAYIDGLRISKKTLDINMKKLMAVDGE